MECQFGVRRRTANWDEIEEAPQIKRYCEDVKAQAPEQLQQQQLQNQNQPNTAQVAQMAQTQENRVESAPQPTAAAAEPPKFYISAPIQGYTADGQGGCRYVFF